MPAKNGKGENLPRSVRGHGVRTRVLLHRKCDPVWHVWPLLTGDHLVQGLRREGSKLEGERRSQWHLVGKAEQRVLRTAIAETERLAIVHGTFRHALSLDQTSHPIRTFVTTCHCKIHSSTYLKHSF